MNRKQRRAMERKLKNAGSDELSAMVAMFGKLPEECTSCELAFDKEDREMVTTWNVIIRKDSDDNPVRLYCPTCWETAQEVVANFLKTIKTEDK
jgi:hypothetical protein